MWYRRDKCREERRRGERSHGDDFLFRKKILEGGVPREKRRISRKKLLSASEVLYTSLVGEYYYEAYGIFII